MQPGPEPDSPPDAPGTLRPSAGPAAGIDELIPAGCDWDVIIGIDPGTRVLGYGALVLAPEAPRLLAAGVLRAPAQHPIAQRLELLQRGLEDLFRRTRPAIVVVEGAFTARNARSALRLGEARGVVLACAARAGAQVTEMAPAAAKKAVVGNGLGGKDQVARMVAVHLGIAPLEGPSDMTDALALALAEFLRRRDPRTQRPR